MSPGRDRSPGPPAMAPRMLRIEYKGQPYDWFNLDEMGDIVRTNDFSSTLRENITHYFGVPFEHQAIYDEEGLLSSMVDFARALRSVRPWLRVYDAREMTVDLKEITSKQLAEIHADVVRSQRSLSSSGWGSASGALGQSAADLSASSVAQPQKLFSSPDQNGQQESSSSMVDAVKKASDLVMDYNACVNNIMSGRNAHDLFPTPATQPTTAFPWSNPALEAYARPQAAASLRFPTPPPGHRFPTPPPGQNFSQASVGAWAFRPEHGAPANMMPLGFPATPPLNNGQPYSHMGQHQMALGGYSGGPLNLPPASRSSGSTTPPMPFSSHGMQHSVSGPEEAWRSALSRGDMAHPSAAPHEVMRQVTPTGSAQLPPGSSADFRAASARVAAMQEGTTGHPAGAAGHPARFGSSADPGLDGAGASGHPGAAGHRGPRLGPGAANGATDLPASGREEGLIGPGAGAHAAAAAAAHASTGQHRGKGLVEVVLSKSKEPGCERFGFANVPTRENRALAISWVDPSGLLQTQWNRKVDLSKRIMENDVIISVNGVQTSVEAMRAELQKDSVHLVIQHESPSEDPRNQT